MQQSDGKINLKVMEIKILINLNVKFQSDRTFII